MWPLNTKSESAATKQYTVEVGTAKPGETAVRRHYLNKDKALVESNDPSNTTLWSNFLNGIKIAGDSPFLGKRAVVGGVPGPYVWQSYQECYELAKNFGAGLLERGHASEDRIALYSINRTEWVLAEYGCYAYNMTTVPLYDTLGADAIKHIINQTELKTVVCSKDKVKNLLHLKADLPTLKAIVSMDALDEETVAACASAGVDIVAFESLAVLGAKNAKELKPPTAEDICTICYTSGTTGLPKGVVLTHRNLLSVSQAYIFSGMNGAGCVLTKDDSHISYLPLAHVFERAMYGLFIGVGARIGFYQGDTLKLLEDIAELRPTFFASVPRLFNRIYDKVWAQVKAKGGVSEALFNVGHDSDRMYAFNAKKANLENGVVTHPIWDKLVFSKTKARLGGRVRYIITGSAPLSSEVMAFLRCAFCCDVFEGYGQTETSAGAFITVLGDTSLGNVGAPFPCCECKLVDVPEMNYTSKDTPFPRGEVCFRGANCFKEYYKMPDKTAETVDSDGWIHSGDIGMWDAQGRLKIVDRKKNIFKLSQGEYVAPEKIENIYITHELVAQAFVYGDSLQATLVGIIVPDEAVLKAWAEHNKLADKSFAELCKTESVKKHLLQSIQQHGKACDLKGFENVKNIHLEHELFTVDNDLLTPTFKLKRFEAKQKYQKEIDALYAELSSPAE